MNTAGMISRTFAAGVAILLAVGCESGNSEAKSDAQPQYASMAAAAAPDPESRPENREVTVCDLAARGERYLGKTVTVAGTLKNRGTNYFTDMKLVLEDRCSDGPAYIHVRPWLPTSAALPGGADGEARETLSNYMDRRVLLTGTYRSGAMKGVGQVNLLAVGSAQIVPE